MSTKNKTKSIIKTLEKLENLNLASSSVGFFKCFRFKLKAVYQQWKMNLL